MAEILSEREMIGHLMENILDEATRPWGVKVERVEIKVKQSKQDSSTLQHLIHCKKGVWPLNFLVYLSFIKIYIHQDVRVPVQLQRAMAAEAEAAREARAKVVAAEGEQKASIHLKEAAIVLEQSNSALQLRYLQVKHKLCCHVTCKIDYLFVDTECNLIGAEFHNCISISYGYSLSGHGKVQGREEKEWIV